jgi:hypothetical protein
MDQTTAATLAAMDRVLSNGVDGAGVQALAKAGYTANATSTAGVQGYDLSPIVLTLYPFLAPFSHGISYPGSGAQGPAYVAREADGFGSGPNWKAYLTIDSTFIPGGVSEGNRNATQTPTMADYSGTYKGFGMEHQVTDEAYYAGAGFVDLLARAQVENLQSSFLKEEWLDLFGNTTTTGIALGTANTPSGTKTAGGSMTAQATVCYVVGLTGMGWYYNQQGSDAAVTAGVKVQYTRTNADGSTDTIKPGHGIISAESSAITTETTNLSVLWKVLPKRGELAWAWFTGTTGAATCKLAKITSVPQFLQTVDAAGTQLANVADLGVDNSQHALDYDGVFTQISKSGSNGYFKIMGGTVAGGAKLTPNGLGGIVEIDAANLDRFVNYKLGVDTWWVNAQQAGDIQLLCLSNSAGTDKGIATVFYPANIESMKTIIGGNGGPEFIYINRATGMPQRIKTHPWIPAGTMLGTSQTIPYNMNNVPSVWKKKLRKEWYSEMWPKTSRKQQFGQYADGLLQCLVPFANAVIVGVLPTF